MPTQNGNLSRIVISLPGREHSRKTLPSLLKAATRSTVAGEDPFVNERVVQVEASFDLSAKHRSAGEEERRHDDH